MSTPNSVGRYDIGDLVTLTATVLGTGGASAVQPSYFAFLVRSPDPGGSVATFVAYGGGGSVANPATGCFFKDVTADNAGKWFYRAVATGMYQAVEEWSFLCDASFVL